MADFNQLVSYTPTHHNDTYPGVDPLAGPSLSGRTVVITGASKGIGYATALSFARAGASNIVVGARSPLDKLQEEILEAAKKANRDPPNVLAVHLDVTKEESVKEMAAQTEAKFGGVDVLINNAGYLERWLNVGDPTMDVSEWWRSWEVNILGTYLSTRHFIPLLLKKENGLKTVFSVSSIGAFLLAEGSTAYQPAKLAVVGFTERLVKEYEEEGLVAMAVNPGGVATELASGLPEKWHFLLTVKAELPADTFVWLAKERREWLNGRYLSVEWDMQELEAMKDDIVERDLLKAKLSV